jgi:hypothetical protein
MRTIKKLYRSNYQGESIVVNLNHDNGEWNTDLEWIPTAVYNNKVTTQAVIIGNGDSRKQFDMSLIKNHRGGLLAKNKLQSYGCNGLYKEYEPDFLVAIGDSNLKEIADSGYTDKHIVYTNASGLVDFPKKFYLIPQDPTWNAGSLAAYLACFDGHKTVYLLGFDSDVAHADSDAFYATTMAHIMSIYNDVKFIRVMPTAGWAIPKEWQGLTNFSQVDFYGFSLSADI